MKNYVLTAMLFTLSILGYSQTMEPEIVRKGNGVVYMLDGSKLEGEITFTHTLQTRLILKTSEGEQKIKVKEIKEFVIDGARYTKIASGALSVGDDQVVARCLTPENFKISLYEHISQGIIGTNNLYKTERSYYVKFPTEEKVRPLGDIYFTPFNKKVSKLVEDCPTLSKKILDKEKDYKLGLITTPELQLEVFLRVANEYQDCK